MFKHFATPLATTLAALAIVAAATPAQAASASTTSSGSSTSSYKDASGQQWTKTESRGVKRTFVFNGVPEAVTGTLVTSTPSQSSDRAASSAAAGCTVTYFLGDPYYSTAAGGQARNATSLEISSGCQRGNAMSANLRKKVGLTYAPTVAETGVVYVNPGASVYRSMAAACGGSYEYFSEGGYGSNSRVSATKRLCPA